MIFYPKIKPGYYIYFTDAGYELSKIDIDNQYDVLLNKSGVFELCLPNGVINVYCYDNHLTELYLPDSVKWIDCRENDLTELIVPDDCIVHCDNTVKVITRTMFNRSNRLKAILK